jgi:hypothetical protein
MILNLKIFITIWSSTNWAHFYFIHNPNSILLLYIKVPDPFFSITYFIIFFISLTWFFIFCNYIDEPGDAEFVACFLNFHFQVKNAAMTKRTTPIIR